MSSKKREPRWLPIHGALKGETNLQADSYRKGPPKANPKPKLVAVVGAKPRQLRAGGLLPSESMSPGEYIANCEGATLTSKGRATLTILEFRIIDGPHRGTSIRQWITVPDVDGIVSLDSRYGKQCALALGREIESGDDLNPAAIFKSKTFRVEVGYRLTAKIGGQHDPKNALFRKDAKDFLRVHRILAVEEVL
jgi:hypothetical protein